MSLGITELRFIYLFVVDGATNSATTNHRGPIYCHFLFPPVNYLSIKQNGDCNNERVNLHVSGWQIQS